MQVQYVWPYRDDQGRLTHYNQTLIIAGVTTLGDARLLHLHGATRTHENIRTPRLTLICHLVVCACGFCLNIYIGKACLWAIFFFTTLALPALSPWYSSTSGEYVAIP